MTDDRAQRLCNSLVWLVGFPNCVYDRDELIKLLKEMGHEHNDKCENYENEQGLDMEELEALK